jgi:hypothetical protein
MHILLAAVLLAGEPVALDDDARPRFTEHQKEASVACTREGFTLWAATPQGKAILAKFRGEDRDVRVIENAEEPGVGRAPQPSFVTFLAMGGESKVKHYDLILNPARASEYGDPQTVNLGLPRTPADVMAVAWAAEMLHIDFYADGIPLPHHHRADFQERWMRVAGALGFPLVSHDSGD